MNYLKQLLVFYYSSCLIVWSGAGAADEVAAAGSASGGRWHRLRLEHRHGARTGEAGQVHQHTGYSAGHRETLQTAAKSPTAKSKPVHTHILFIQIASVVLNITTKVHLCVYIETLVSEVCFSFL